MSISIQKVLLVLSAVFAFIMPWVFITNNLWINFFMGFSSGVIGGTALRLAMGMGTEDNE